MLRKKSCDLSAFQLLLYSGRLGNFWFYWGPFTCPWELLLINLNVATIVGRLCFLLFPISFSLHFHGVQYHCNSHMNVSLNGIIVAKKKFKRSPRL